MAFSVQCATRLEPPALCISCIVTVANPRLIFTTLHKAIPKEIIGII